MTMPMKKKMMDEFLSSTVTWPRSHLPPKVKSEFQKRARLQAALGNLKLQARQLDDENVTKLVENLREMCSNFEDQKSAPVTMPGNRLNQSKKQAGSFYGSMILCTPPPSAMDKGSVQLVDGQEVLVVEEQQPTWVGVVAVMLMVFGLFCYLILGTFIFRILEPAFREKKFYEVFMLPLQTCLTIGWGNLPLTTASAQLFCIIYALIAVSLTHTTLTRIAQFWYPNYIPDWLLNSASIHCKVGQKDEIVSFPLIGALKFLLGFHIVGLIIFNGFIGDFGIIEALYFDYFTSSFIGFGDIIPTPADVGQSVLLFFYLPYGGIFQAVYHAFATYWVQRFFYVKFRNFLYNLHLKRQLKLQNSK